MSDGHSKAIRERIHGRLREYGGRAFQGPCRVSELGVASEGSTGRAWIFQIEGTAGASRLFVKTYSESKQGAYEQEVAAAKAIGKALRKEGRYRVPELVDHWNDLNAVVFEAVDGRPVGELISRSATRSFGAPGQAVQRALSGVGGWLAHLHNETYAGEGGLGADRVEDLRLRIGGALRPRPLSAWLIRRPSLECARRLAGVERRARRLPMPIARCHGDLRPDNLMLDGSGRIWGVDACADRVEPVYIEVMHFLATLRMGRDRLWWPPSLRRLDCWLLLEYARRTTFRLSNRAVGLRLCRAYAQLRLLANALERWPAVRWKAPLEATWVLVNHLRPLEAHLTAAERALARRGL